MTGSSTEIIFSSTKHLADAIREGHISAIEALETHLAHIEKHNPALNAVVTLDSERAVERAHAADQALARGKVWGPLHGVPFTLKDAHATAGMRTTTGFPPLAGYVSQEDGTVAARLIAAGGILMGKTNVAMLLGDPAQTGNPIFGRTNNPWNIGRTPGGSSGGATAAVASGMSPLEVGTDLSGSIRIPAHFCGLFGLKPTEHRISLIGLIPGIPPPRSVRIMSCVGPLTRTAEDLSLLYRILAGPDGLDTDVPPAPVSDSPEIELKRMRIAFAPTFPGLPVAANIRKAIETLAFELDAAGAVVEEADLPGQDFHLELTQAGELIGMMLGAFQPEEKKPPVTLAQYLEALDKRDKSIIAWEQFFEKWDILLCPPCMTTAFPHCDPGSPLQVIGKEEIYWMVSGHTTLFNYTGHPAVVLPYKLDQDGLPLGIQMVGKRWDEARLLAITKAISEITGESKIPPGY